MSVGITSGGRFFRRDGSLKRRIAYPYRTIICGEEYIIRGWNDGNLLTEKGECAFRRLQGEDVDLEWQGEINRVPKWCRLSETSILEIATVGFDDKRGWLLNGLELGTLINLPSGSRLHSITQSEIFRVHKQEIRAVAWIEAISSGSKTHQLDAVLADWKTAKSSTAGAQFSPLNNLNFNLFAGWSKPIWLSEFHCLGEGNPWMAGMSQRLNSPAPVYEPMADLLKKGQNPYLAGLENISTNPAEIKAEVRKPARNEMTKLSRSRCVAKFKNDFTIAIIPKKNGRNFALTVEEELRNLLKLIINSGGSKPRTELRKTRPASWQPEKLLASATAKALMKAGLLGKQKNGRTVVYWARRKSS